MTDQSPHADGGALDASSFVDIPLNPEMFGDPEIVLPREDEMAAGIIHEPGTGGLLDGSESYVADELQLRDIERALHNDAGVSCYKRAQNAIDQIRARPCDDPDFAEVDDGKEILTKMLEDSAATNLRLFDELDQIKRQLGLLDSVAGSYIERMAGEIVARGFMTLTVAQAWVNEERIKVQHAMAQIANAAQQEVQP